VLRNDTAVCAAYPHPDGSASAAGERIPGELGSFLETAWIKKVTAERQAPVALFSACSLAVNSRFHLLKL